MPAAVYLSPEWAGAGVPEPVPFAFLIPKSLRVSGTSLYVHCAAVGPNLTPGQSVSADITLPT